MKYVNAAVLAGAFLLCSTAAAQVPSIPPGLGVRPDLVVSLHGTPTTMSPGASLGAAARGVARNVGGGLARGSRPGQTGYMVDVVLSTDMSVPAGFALYNASFTEDVLLQGGRHSVTPDLGPGASHIFSIQSYRIPANTPAGSYYLCARIDPGNAVAESNEANNVSCRPVRVLRRIPH